MSSKPDSDSQGWKDTRTLRVRATPQQLWEAWAEPERLKAWFPDDARGTPEPGGEIVHVWEAFGFEVPHKVIEAEPGRLLVLEAHAPHGVPFRQQIHVEQDGDETVLRLVHSGFGDDADWGDEYEGIDSGWKMAFALLRLYLEHYRDRTRESFTLMRPASFDPAEVYRLFSTDQGLSRWLGEASGMGTVGSELTVTLPGGDTLSGPVLAATGLEVCLAWEELEGALELKAFSMGPDQQCLSLRGHTWHADPSRIEHAREHASAALERLLAVTGEAAPERDGTAANGGSPPTGEATSAESTEGERAAALAAGWFEAWSRYDMEWLRRRLAPDFVHLSPFGRFDDRETYLEAVEPMARKSVMELAVKETIARGDVAVVRYESRTPRGVVEACDWIRAEGDSIKEVRSFYDSPKIREILSATEQESLDGSH